MRQGYGLGYYAEWFEANYEFPHYLSLGNQDMNAERWLPQQVVAAACGDRSREVYFSNLFDVNAKYGDVVAEKEALEKLKAGW